MPTKLDLAEQWLRAFMKQHRSAPSKQIKEAAREAGISSGNLHLARQRIGEIEIVDLHTFPRSSQWLYKADAPPPKSREPEPQPERKEVPLLLDMRQFADHARAMIVASRRKPYRRPTDRWPLS